VVDGKSRTLDYLSAVSGYEFNNPTLLNAALTHRSYSKDNNERLEYLGDAMLGFIIAEALCQKFPAQPEGVLTRLRASLVKEETLAELARSLKLGDLLILGAGEIKSGGWRRDSILSNAMEALIASIYLDSNIEKCRSFVLHIYSDLLANLSTSVVKKDPKTDLQEYLQARKRPLPVYEVTEEESQDHVKIFTVRCTVEEIEHVVTAQGKSKRNAEQSAAQKALEILHQNSQ